MFEHKITKIRLIWEKNNDMEGHLCHYEVKMRVYTDETRTRFWRRNFVISVSNEDIAEYLDKDTWTDKEGKMTRDEFVWSFAESLCSNATIEAVTAECAYTIERYNRMLHAWNHPTF